MSHPHRMPVPSSPGLPPSLYSGMSSLQINQAGPGSVARSSYHPSASQPQKALLKSPKAGRHQSRKNEHTGSSAPWRDPREAAAASSGRKRSLRDDASFRQGQTMWTPFPPDARPTSREEATVTMRAVVDRLKEQERRIGFATEAEREVMSLSESMVNLDQRLDEHVGMVRQDHRSMEPVLLRLLQMSPNEEFRQACQNVLNVHYKNRRNAELRRASGH